MTIRRFKHAHIKLWDHNGATHGTIEIDGAEIEGGVSKLALTAGNDQSPYLELNGAIAEFGEVDVQLRGVRYGLSQATKRALIELGWTPPSSGEF